MKFAGKLLSDDQMQSSQAGFCAQPNGQLKTINCCGDLFVEHFSWLYFGHLMTSLSYHKQPSILRKDLNDL
jgi:hypothetical protein